MVQRTFKVKIREMIFEVTIKPLFNIFGWTLVLMKAKRFFKEDSDAKG